MSADFERHAPCSRCGSSDGLAVYDNGWAHCFVCKTNQKLSSSLSSMSSFPSSLSSSQLAAAGTFRAIPNRGLHLATCRKFNYTVGKGCHIAGYCDASGRTVAQKIRKPGKEFSWRGNASAVGLFGQHLWKGGGKQIVVTEGEIDCLTVSQLNGNKWPVVSLPNGAASAEQSVAKSIAFLESFESVILMFDSDEPGREAATKAARLFTPGKVRIAKLPGKDPNELHVNGRGAEVLDAMWQASEWRPDGIISIDDVLADAAKPAEWGRPWGHKLLNALTYGTRFRELYALGAGVGSGKTDLFTQWIADAIKAFPAEPVGAIFLEQPAPETAKRIAGKLAGKPFHIPDGPWKPKELAAALDLLRGRAYLYNHFGSLDWPTISSSIRYFALSCGVKHVYLDHLTALTSHEEDERRGLDRIMAELSGLADNLNISIFFVSHLATPQGSPHEEGGRVMAKHFRGSRSIMQWAHFMFGLERNQQAENEIERRTAYLRCLKDRNTGQATGKGLSLLYDSATGILNECESCPFESYDDDNENPSPTNDGDL